MLRSILDLGDVAVGEVMVHRSNMAAIDVDQPAEALIDQVAASPHTRLPLWRGTSDNIVGVIHSKTLLRALREHPDDFGEPRCGQAGLAGLVHSGIDFAARSDAGVP